MPKKTARKIVVGNWKMNSSTPKEAEKLFTAVSRGLSRVKRTEVVICPPFIYLSKLGKLSKKISLGAQDAFWGETGAFTGEISPEMLYNLGVRYVILGHSERRALGEENTLINKKLKSALEAGLVPILCVGERERDTGHGYFDIVKTQLKDCLRGVNKDSLAKIIVAYEPVWALSSTAGRRDATADDSREMAIYIRKVLSDISSPEIVNKARIIYGGSGTERDAEDFLRHGGVDGVLPGRASLDAKKFTEIIRIAESL